MPVLGAAVDDSDPSMPVELSIIQARMACTLDQCLYAGEGNTASTARRLGLIGDIAAGLRYMHAKNIVHGDLKPTNVLLDSRGVARITDVGLATLFGMQGTLPYVDPGLLAGTWLQCSASDVYSFGILAWEVLCGRRPFEGVPSDGLMQTIAAGGRPDLTRLPADVPAGLSEVLCDCWRPAYADHPRMVDLSVFFLTLALLARPSTSAVS